MDTERVKALYDADDILFDRWMKTNRLNNERAWSILYHAWRYVRNQHDQELASEE